VISTRYHTAVAESMAEVCSRLKSDSATNTVALTGGVFQNVRLLELSKARLIDRGFKVLTHRIVPPNDGGLSLGQAVIGLTR
jgi:hydrogenase maturation protein HypF